ALEIDPRGSRRGRGGECQEDGNAEDNRAAGSQIAVHRAESSGSLWDGEPFPRKRKVGVAGGKDYLTGGRDEVPLIAGAILPLSAVVPRVTWLRGQVSWGLEGRWTQSDRGASAGCLGMRWCMGF